MYVVCVVCVDSLPGHRVRRTSSMAWLLVGLEEESLKERE